MADTTRMPIARIGPRLFAFISASPLTTRNLSIAQHLPWFDSRTTLFYDATERQTVGPLGVPELIFIFILALLIFGPKKLPELGRTIGKALTEFRRASNEMRSAVESEIRDFEREAEEAQRQVQEATNVSLDSGESSVPAPAEALPINPPEAPSEPRGNPENPAHGGHAS
jgi:TatA/E family protein of Tat protein translocase